MRLYGIGTSFINEDNCNNVFWVYIFYVCSFPIMSLLSLVIGIHLVYYWLVYETSVIIRLCHCCFITCCVGVRGSRFWILVEFSLIFLIMLLISSWSLLDGVGLFESSVLDFLLSSGISWGVNGAACSLVASSFFWKV